MNVGRTSIRVLAASGLAVSLLLASITVIIAAVWLPIDDAMIGRADDAGWDETMLFPHWEVLWLSIVGAVIVSFVLLAINLVICVIAFRGSRVDSGDPTVARLDRLGAV
ncbi:hypothetical protein [Lacisediminihabitans sp.]|jgi:hypothetical protein|uniref:hypothetical protein n=1 Tax=Lacisediminihabitans sp. TaxID=2787631 RepID=UPI002F93E6B7